MLKKSFALASFTLLGLLTASPASAQKKTSHSVTVYVTIVGRLQQPIASVDVERIAPKLTLTELRQPLLERIEKSTYAAPF